MISKAEEVVAPVASLAPQNWADESADLAVAPAAGVDVPAVAPAFPAAAPATEDWSAETESWANEPNEWGGNNQW